MRFAAFLLIAVISLSFFISCGGEGDDSIYGETSDYVYEEPDTTNDNYQTRPDTNDKNVIVQDEDNETDDW